MRPASRSEPNEATPRLSPRLRQVAENVCLGLRDDEIAFRLKLSRHTVRSYIKLLFDVFNCGSRVLLALRFTESVPKNGVTNVGVLKPVSKRPKMKA